MRGGREGEGERRGEEERGEGREEGAEREQRGGRREKGRGGRGGGRGRSLHKFHECTFWSLLTLFKAFPQENAPPCGALSWVAAWLCLWNAHTSDVTDVVQ